MQTDQPPFPYEQAAATIRERIRKGELAKGQKLPSHAALADELGVAIGTVERALKVLKDEGLIISRPALGTFVK